MSVKQVTCPKCRSTLNVVASMTSVQCSSCGTVFNPAAPATSRAAVPSHEPQSSDSGMDPTLQWLLMGGMAGLILLGVVGVILFSMNTPPPPPPPPVVKAPLDESIDLPDDYKVVDLPLATKKRIYLEYNQMIESSFGKADKVPKSGVAGQQLRGMLTETVNREIRHFALLHNVSEEDIRNVIAEGKAEGW